VKVRPPALAVIALVAGAFFSFSAQAQAGTDTVEGYWETLQEIRAELRTDPEPPRDTLDAFADRLEAVTAVKFPDGTRLPVDHRYLAGLLRADPLQTGLLLDMFDNAFTFKNSRGGIRFDESDLNALAIILSGPEYRWPEPAPPNPLTELWQRLLNGFVRLLARLAPGASAGAVINTVLLIGIAVTIGLILRYVYVHSVRSVIREAGIDPVTGIPPDLTADRAFEQARNYADAEDRREAVRYLYLAAILVLEARGHIRLDRAHTNRELLADLSPRPELAAGFRDVIETFDRVWYGFQPISREEFGKYSDAVTELQNQRA
jgi:hypothetical protein